MSYQPWQVTVPPTQGKYLAAWYAMCHGQMHPFIELQYELIECNRACAYPARRVPGG